MSLIYLTLILLNNTMHEEVSLLWHADVTMSRVHQKVKMSLNNLGDKNHRLSEFTRSLD